MDPIPLPGGALTAVTTAPDASADNRLRSGTVARLAGVPVATLRIWERRYGVVDAPKSATGQRLYSGHDVQRLRLLRQLTERGHAIGTLAALGLQPLQALWSDATGTAPAAAAPAGPRRVVAVGRHAANKLAAAPGCLLLAVFDDLAAVALAAAGAAPERLTDCDVLLLHLPSLQPALAEQVLTLAAQWQAAATVVLYGFGAEPVAERLRAAGVLVRRDPISASELARLIAQAAPRPVPVPAVVALAPERSFSDDDLMTLADMPSNVACECPRHLAEILLQLGAFERYSSDCQSRGPADAALHQHLSQLAGTARSLFEQALHKVMADEGLVLPTPG
jgi:MerR family transcriptional regulator, light-induced transcriptional regulator